MITLSEPLDDSLAKTELLQEVDVSGGAERVLSQLAPLTRIERKPDGKIRKDRGRDETENEWTSKKKMPIRDTVSSEKKKRKMKGLEIGVCEETQNPPPQKKQRNKSYTGKYFKKQQKTKETKKNLQR